MILTSYDLAANVFPRGNSENSMSCVSATRTPFSRIRLRWSPAGEESLPPLRHDFEASVTEDLNTAGAPDVMLSIALKANF